MQPTLSGVQQVPLTHSFWLPLRDEALMGVSVSPITDARRRQRGHGQKSEGLPEQAAATVLEVLAAQRR